MVRLCGVKINRGLWIHEFAKFFGKGNLFNSKIKKGDYVLNIAKIILKISRQLPPTKVGSLFSHELQRKNRRTEVRKVRQLQTF